MPPVYQKRLLISMGSEICGHTLSRRFHSLVAFFPVGGADIPIFFGKLQGMENPQGLIDTSSERQIVYHLMADNALTIDEKEPAQCYTDVKQYFIGFGNRLVEVGNQRILNITDAAVINFGLFPCQVSSIRLDNCM